MIVKLQRFVVRISKLGFYAIVVIQSLSVCMAGEVAARQKSLNEVSIGLNKGQGSRSVKTLNGSISMLEAKGSDDLPQVVQDINMQTSLNGKVTDENGEPLPGATVLEKGTTNGTVTDIDGKFKLSVNEDATILVSFVGYISQEINVSGRDFVAIQMLSDSEQLDEVVVMGYGTIRKSDLTGAVASLKIDDATERPSSSIEQLLQGRMTGVQITSNTGAPGGGITFAIRGATSIMGSNQPLIVVDGYPIDSDNSGVRVSDNSQSDYLSQLPSDNALASLNPADIASVEILKDASATAIYGSRASNGVVLITTKQGKGGEDKISYNFRYDISRIPKLLNVLNAADYISFANEGYLNDGLDSLYSETEINEFSQTNTNWQELIFETAHSQNHQVNISGGDNGTKYALSMGYLGQEGIVKNSRFDRGSIRINLDRKLNRKLDVGLNVSASMSKNRAAMQSSNRTDPSTSVIHGGLRSRPFLSPYTAEDEIDQTQQGNPLTLVELANDENQLTTVLVNSFMQYEIAKGLNFKVRGGVNNSYSRRDFYHPRGTTLGDLEGGYAYTGQGTSFNYLTEYTLNYNNTIGNKNRINAVLGHTWQEWTRRSIAINVLNFPNDNLSYYDLSSGASVSNPRTTTTQWALASYLGRINYSFDNKYLLTITGRYDGSTRLADGNKWAFFPSIALGWNLHNEEFLKGAGLLSELKIRGSYGLSGNQSIGIGATKSRLNSVTSVVANSIQIGYVPANMANGTLHWETTKQTNLGLDLGILEDRITFNFEYYKKLTNDLLIGLTIPASNGFTSYNTNQGSVENTGYEFAINAELLSRELKWRMGGNISFNQNKITDLGSIESFIGPSFTAVGGQSMHIAQVGYPIGSFYGYRIGGIYQTQAEVDAGPADVLFNKPGTYRFVDISGPEGVRDSLITEDDREIIGNPYPDFIFGISNNLDYKGFSLSIFIQGSIGQDVINANRYYLDGLSVGPNISQTAYDNRWTGESTNNTYPRANASNTPFGNRFTDFIVEDASFVRLKNVTLSYTFSRNTLKYFSSIKLFVSGGNLFTLTNYTGYDPEINSRGDNSLTPGVDSGSIPQYKTYSIGASIGI